MKTIAALILLALALGGGFVYGAVGAIVDDTGPDW